MPHLKTIKAIIAILILAALAPSAMAGEEALTRYEVCTLIVSEFDLKLTEINSEFTDLPLGHADEVGVYTLVERGIITGYPDGTFRGEDQLNRYQWAVIVSRLAESLDYQPSRSLFSKPRDVGTEHWAFPHVTKYSHLILGQENSAGDYHGDDPVSLLTARLTLARLKVALGMEISPDMAALLDDSAQPVIPEQPAGGPAGTTYPGTTTPIEPASEPFEGMVLVKSGVFWVGKSSGEGAGRELQKAFLGDFYIDKYEVTNAEYRKFVSATGHPAPQSWLDGRPDPQKLDHPVRYVTLSDAEAYAAWAGKRLPSEEEWEKACRGEDGRAYPWGEAFQPGLANYNSGNTTAVGSYADGASPSGVLDMAGNVWEWTSTRFNDKDGLQRATALVEGRYGCLKGGSYLNNSRGLYSWNRKIMPLGETDAYVRDFYAIGFRCARDVKR